MIVLPTVYGAKINDLVDAIFRFKMNDLVDDDKK